ncbi:glycosyltransferase 87 family protein [uncultured Corynebacterium sp.]|uniref:glycosyltransferase 87 family protein n=1 Tax=uncultured Corynebacterium sp. TaxID=159447 RepID=UPI0025D0EFB8|nr:glycosyltransferase 87 family protein [uncultured Corynebacterium sp.]
MSLTETPGGVPQPTPRPRAALWGVLGILALVVLRRDTNPFIFGEKGLNLFQLSPDFMVYYTAGEHLNNGLGVYDGGLWGFLPFTYPPFAAAAFRVLPLFPPQDAAILWAMVCAGCLIAVTIGVLVQRGWRLDAGTATLGVLAAVGAMSLAAVRESFFYGQINLVLMLLVSLDFLRRRDRFTGIGVGLAAGLKLTPAFFIAVMLLQRRFRDAAVATGTFLATVVVGLVMVPDATRFWTSALFDDSRIGTLDNPGAQSLKAMAVRWLGHEGTDATALWAAMVVIVLAAAAAAVVEAHRRGNDALVMALGGVTACLVSPFSWHHHWVWLVPLALCLVDLTVRATEQVARHRGNSRWWVPQVGVLLGATVVVAVMLPYVSTTFWFTLTYWWMQGQGKLLATWYTWQGAVFILIAGSVALWLRRRDGQPIWPRRKPSPREKLPVAE